MTLRSVLDADLEVHARYLGKARRHGFRLELLLTAANPYFCPVLLCRLAHHLHVSGRRLPAIAASKINYFVFGIEIARQTEIGPGLFFPHTRGTVIGAARIGARAVIYHGVTLGARSIDIGFNTDTRPTLGDGVLVGAGAVVLGPAHVGDGASIGANAVVVTDVPDGATLLAPSPVPRAARPT